jgi:hypothetical protein
MIAPFLGLRYGDRFLRRSRLISAIDHPACDVSRQARGCPHYGSQITHNVRAVEMDEPHKRIDLRVLIANRIGTFGHVGLAEVAGDRLEYHLLLSLAAIACESWRDLACAIRGYRSARPFVTG